MGENDVRSYPAYTTGIVIPIWQTKFIYKLIKRILKTISLNDACICIVNDGKPDVAQFLAKHTWPQHVSILNLPENIGFAGANNAGWEYLTKKFHTIKYLGTLNDDTIPRDGWLEAMVKALGIYPKTAIAAPIMETRGRWLVNRNSYAVYQVKDIKAPWVCTKGEISEDTFVSAVSGFCFIGLRAALEEIEYFEEAYRNSCEDLDLCLKLLSRDWRIVVCKDARVFHRGGCSRYVKGTNTDLDSSHKLLAKRWGHYFQNCSNLSKYKD